MKQHPKYQNLLVGEDGTIFSKITKRFLTPTIKNDSGYMVVYVSDVGKLQRVHRLVAETFLQDSQFFGLDVNHIDGVKTNNHVTNLEWCTRSHNIIHAKELGLNRSRGETHVDSIHTEAEIRVVCSYLEQGFRNQDISSMTGLSTGAISDIRIGRRWKHVSRDYKFTAVSRNTRLSVKKVEAICERFSQGASIEDVMKDFSVSYKVASNIYNRETNIAVSIKYKW